MQFPNDVQAALLFDRRVTSLDEIARTFLKLDEAQSGPRYNVSEAKPGVFYRFFGRGELMITLEYVDNPAEMSVFQQPLGSAVTGRLCPDIRQRLAASRSHILINVSHGMLGSVAREPSLAAMFAAIGMQEGHSLPEFKRRLEVLTLLTRIANECTPAQVVHWTHSNQLYPGELFELAAAEGVPGPLDIHPWLFGPPAARGGKALAGMRTFGARHFIGREILVEPNVLPWTANYETILTLLRVATAENGYIIPDGDTFGPEDGRLSYRVIHHEAEEGDVPLLEMVPLFYREYGFQTEDYISSEHAFDTRCPPANLVPADQDGKQELANEWHEKRALAEGIGGRFEVRALGAGGRPPTPPAGSRFLRMFRRKGA
ncbi:MAG: hypothetical protein ABIS51_11380 [Sphingomonas sp.]